MSEEHQHVYLLDFEPQFQVPGWPGVYATLEGAKEHVRLCGGGTEWLEDSAVESWRTVPAKWIIKRQHVGP